MKRVTDYIEEVRGRSEEEKQRAVFLWTIIFIVAIFIIWVVSFSVSVTNNSAQEAELRAEAKRLAEEKAVAAESANVQATSTFKGLIPEAVDLVKDGAGTVVDGFWAIGNMMHK